MKYKAGWAVGLMQKNKIVAQCSHLHDYEQFAIDCGRALAKDWRRKRGPGRIAIACIPGSREEEAEAEAKRIEFHKRNAEARARLEEWKRRTNLQDGQRSQLTSNGDDEFTRMRDLPK